MDDSKFAYSVDEAARKLGIGRSMIYELLASGEIPAKKLGRRTLIVPAELERFVEGLPKASFE